ncbi:MAG: hypothetical protein HC915_17040 [Anaerolineae bacterium]|nr:hypothetical protein [Anaerolineae bacterium]
MNPNFDFDSRVAERYNQQRAHPPEVSRQIGVAIAQLAGGVATCWKLALGRGGLPIQ